MTLSRIIFTLENSWGLLMPIYTFSLQELAEVVQGWRFFQDGALKGNA